MFLIWLGIFRNGEIRLSFDTAGIYAEEISVLQKADGTREITYTDYYHKTYCDKL
ncbi:MAG: hypothetical protein IJ642_00100 [Oscillospiraceae bacterium]|nr:hypothetical protein [Oscillospiraceae bacterium]